MKLKTELRRTGWICLFILLTTFGPAAAVAQKSCDSIFLSVKAIDNAPKKSTISVSNAQEVANLNWQTKFSKIKSVGEFEKLLSFIKISLPNMSDSNLSALQK